MHSSTGRSPFETCFGYLPKSPMDFMFGEESQEDGHGDQVWLHISKERMKGEGKKLKSIRYGPFRIVEKIGHNAFQLNFPPYMHIY